MRQQKATRRPRGFTLVEVMAATLLTTIGLMAVFYLVGLGTAINTDARNTAQAYQAAQQEIEIIRNMPYTATGTFTGLINLSRAASTPEARFIRPDGTDDASRPRDNGYPGLVPAPARLPNASGGVIITNDATAGNKVKNVTVVVRWTDRGNEQRNVMLGTQISQGGIDPR